MIFWMAFAIDLAMAGGFLAFFAIGLGDGSVSAFNMGLWLGILGVLGAVLFGSLALRRSGRGGWALLLALSCAVPGALTGLGLLAMLLAPGRWN